MNSIFNKITELRDSNQAFVLVTVVSSTGSSPGKEGFKLILDSHGNTFGTVGGGAIELEVISQSRKYLASGKGGLISYLLSKNVKPKSEDEKIIPMMCGGRMKVFYEVFGKKQVVYVFGGGHVGQELIPMLKQIGYYVILVDNRNEFVFKEKNKSADEKICADYIEYTSKFTPDSESMCLLLTHGHNYDYEILNQIYSRKLKMKYVGVIASKAKAATLKKNIKNNLDQNIELTNFHAPIGLNIGGDSAAEIALSISAELQSVKYNLTANFK